MSLYVTINLSGSAVLKGVFDPSKNRVELLEIINGQEIIESLKSVIAEHDMLLPLVYQSIYLVSTADDATSFAGPWLRTVRIKGNCIEGLDSSNDSISLSVDLKDTFRDFWSGTFEKIIIGSGPYSV